MILELAHIFEKLNQCVNGSTNRVILTKRECSAANITEIKLIDICDIKKLSLKPYGIAAYELKRL